MLRPLTLLVLLCSCDRAQTTTATALIQKQITQIEQSLESARTPQLTTRRFKQSDLRPLLNTLPATFVVDTAGRSVEDRPLWRVRWGQGDTQVLLWSQMHGDEPTATASLFDLFTWLETDDPATNDIRQTIRENTTLTFLPMLNPDGAERYQRRNALGIDLNRDALRLTSPEARLLKEERDRLDAEWGFNLHDQSTYYGAGFPSEKGSVISILAPAYDWEKSVDGKREDAMQLIALLNDVWQAEVPERIGRYNDDFEPRAFGDNLQKWGTRTILIESGGLEGDVEKQEIRRLNLLGLLVGLHAIATGSYESVSIDDYWAIPENKYNGIHELKLANADLVYGDTTYRMDIGFRFRERSLPPAYRDYERTASISDLGDLHTFGAFETVDATGKRVRPALVPSGDLDSLVLLDTLPAPGDVLDFVIYGEGETLEAVVIGGEYRELD